MSFRNHAMKCNLCEFLFKWRMVFKGQILYYMFVLEKFSKTAFENKREKSLFWWPEENIRVVSCCISLSETVRGLSSLTLFRVEAGTGASALPREPMFGGVGGSGGGLCSLRGVLTGRHWPATWFRAASGERQESGDSRVARRSAGEMDLHQT